MSEQHLNALLDRYLNKYASSSLHASHGQSFGASMQAQTAQPSASAQQAQSSLTPVPISTDPTPSAHSSTLMPAYASSNGAGAPGPATVTSPAAVYHQTDLALIQSEINLLNKKLHRAPDSFLNTNTMPASATPTLHPSAAQQAAEQQRLEAQPQSQQQMHLRELDQSSFGASQPVQQPTLQQQSQPSFDSTQALQSIAASIQALSPSRKQSARVASDATLPAVDTSSHFHLTTTAGPFVAPPYQPPPSSSPLKARVNELEKQSAKQSTIISDKSFEITNLQRELANAHAKIDAFKRSQKEHDSLKAEYQTLKASLARSEKIRREQLGYIQLLHQQIQFLQTSHQQMLAASPQKQRNAPMTPNGESARSSADVHLQSPGAEIERVMHETLLAQQQQQQSQQPAGEVRISRMDTTTAISPDSSTNTFSHTLTYYSPAKAAALRSHSPTHTSPSGVARPSIRALRAAEAEAVEAAQVAAAARAGAVILHRAHAQGRADAEAEADYHRSHHQAPMPTARAAPIAPAPDSPDASSESFAGPTIVSSTRPHSSHHSRTSTVAVSAKPIRASSHKSARVSAPPSTAASHRSTGSGTARPMSNSHKKPLSTTTSSATSSMRSTQVAPVLKRPTSAVASSSTTHKPTRAALALLARPSTRPIATAR